MFDPQSVRMDQWALTYMGPSAIPFQYVRHASVFRGMRDESAARAYAARVCKWFAEQGAAHPVFVVRGPTSTTSAPFEVVAACCGYSIIARFNPPESAA
jgi:hypothetical protein